MSGNYSRLVKNRKKFLAKANKALDGGRWFTMAIFRLTRKELTKEREENIQAAGMLVLLVLTILVTVSDVGKLF